MEAFPPRPFSLALEDERLELELPDLEELLLELPLELLLEEEDPDLLREREELEDPDPLLEEFFLFLSLPRSDPLFFLSLLLL